jgi:Holliday junction DNA helicase RuvB
MLSRFGIVERLDYYPADELAEVVLRSARLLKIAVEPKAAAEIARRARGTPRIVNRLLRRTRDFAEVLGDGKIDLRMASEALARIFGARARRDGSAFSQGHLEHYKGGRWASTRRPRFPSRAHARRRMNRSCSTRFSESTARGRVVTDRAYEHLACRFRFLWQRLF